MKATDLTLRLICHGYLPNSLTPPFVVQNLENAYPDALAYVRALRKKGKSKYTRARTVRHSVPKRKLSRRTFAIPNPLHQILVSREIAKHAPKLLKFCEASPIALSRPVIGTTRALEAAFGRGVLARERCIRSVGKRYVLRSDFARYYPSIYTHAIPWAIHGKEAARADSSLFGNRLDERIRESQDKQTGGIPIGPDTSFLIGEVVAASVDCRLQQRLGSLSGTRFIDDYCLYFDTHDAAEKALAALHEIAAGLELEVNDFKTEILPLPEPVEPIWKRELRKFDLDQKDTRQGTQLIELFDRAAELAQAFPHDNVLTYAAKIVGSAEVGIDHWPVCQALLLRAVLAEPSLVRKLPEIFEKNRAKGVDKAAVTATVDQLCMHHGPLQQGNEVMWALWFSRGLNFEVGQDATKAVACVDDDLVALTALHLRSEGLMPTLKPVLWEGYIGKQQLYSDHWMLAYEAVRSGWLNPSGSDYTLDDPFFTILRKHDVSFYRTTAVGLGEEDIYGDDALAEFADLDSDDQVVI